MNYKNAVIQKKLMFHNELTLIKQVLCHYWYFQDVGFKFEPHDILMTAYELKNIAICKRC